MKVAVYVRVSREDLHADNQQIAILDWCKTKSTEIHDTYTDTLSGAVEHRPALTRLLADAEKGLFQAVVIWKLDRLGRSLQHLIKTVNFLEKNHVDLICITQNLDTTTSGGKLLFHIFGAIAEFERTLISERTKAGLDRVRAQGKKTLGRPKGKKDSKKRATQGYYDRYDRQDRERQAREGKPA